MNRRRCARLRRSNSLKPLPAAPDELFWTVASGPSFLNYAAGDARAGISCWVGFVIVGAGVNDDRCAAGLEERSGAVAERDVRVQQRRSAVAVGANFQIQKITVVRAVRIVLAVFFSRWIEVAARCLEIGALAFSHCVDVDAVRAGRELVHVHINAYAARGWGKCGRANFLAGGVDDVRVRGLGRLRG